MNTEALRTAGLTGGHVWTTFIDDALELRGDTGGSLRIGPAELDRARIGFEEGKGGRYRVQIWRVGSPEPLTLEPSASTWPAYTRAMLAFAERCARAQRIDRFQSGSTKFDALFPAVLAAPLATGALVVAMFVLADDPWWGRILMALLPVSLFGFLLWTGLTRHWPRPVTAPEQLRIVLPPISNTHPKPVTPPWAREER